MWGAIIGDVVGSVYEWDRIKTKDFEFFSDRGHFTDDSVCTVAVADMLLRDLPGAATLQTWCRRYPHMSYGGWFRQWIWHESPEPYDSFGNGAAMRGSPRRAPQPGRPRRRPGRLRPGHRRSPTITPRG